MKVTSLRRELDPYAVACAVVGNVWHPKISTELLFASYTEFAKTHGERRPLTREALGRFLVSLGAAPTRWRKGVVGEHITDSDNCNGGTSRTAKVIEAADRCHGYSLGELEAARGAFVTVTGLPVNWDCDTPAED